MTATSKQMAGHEYFNAHTGDILRRFSELAHEYYTWMPRDFLLYQSHLSIFASITRYSGLQKVVFPKSSEKFGAPVRKFRVWLGKRREHALVSNFQSLTLNQPVQSPK